jgi:type II secretory pathway pseudopilin PulG
MVELLVTMLLLTIVLFGTTALQLTTIRSVTSGNRAQGATRLAHSMIERYRRVPSTVIQTLPQDTWSVPLNQDLTSMTDVAADGVSPGPYRVESLVEQLGGRYLVTVRVSWHGREQAGVQRVHNVIMSCQKSL